MKIGLLERMLVIAAIGLVVYIASFYVLDLAVGHRIGVEIILLINVASILASIDAMLLAFILLFIREFRTSPRKDNMNILKMALSKDELRVIEIVRKSKGITQDSLRFRLGWSKAKASTILANLDRMGIVQRERTGKTYTVFYRPDRS